LVDEGESLLDAAKREFGEETGIKIKQDFFSVKIAKKKIIPAQKEFIDKLVKELNNQ